jgi:exonuclease III
MSGDLNFALRQNYVRSFVDSYRADVICLQETKMQGVSRRDVLYILGADFDHFLALPSNGASDGILVAWKRHLQATRQILAELSGFP